MNNSSWNDNIALITLWNHWKGPLDQTYEWSLLQQWVTSSFCTTRNAAKRVICLNLTSSDLYGSIPADLGRLSVLQKLVLDHNYLTSLPIEIGHLSTLQELYLKSNQLTGLPTELGRLSTLQVLDISHNQLTSLPAEIGHLTALQTLNLSNNQLTLIPSELGKLSSLRELFLNHNQLTSLPAEFGHLTALRTLEINHNRLTSLPGELCRLFALRWLDLGFNQLTSLPAEFGHLTALRTLEIDHNRLTSLPGELCHLSMLQGLYINNNQLLNVPIDLVFLPELRRFNLSNNCLFDIPTFSRKTEILRDNQQLPTTLEALSSILLTDHPLDGFDFTLYFNKEQEDLRVNVDAKLLATRWSYFHRLLESGLNEAQTMTWDCSALFSSRMGLCLVDYFTGCSPINVASLNDRDCHDLIQHAEYLELQDTVLFQFCQAKLAHAKAHKKSLLSYLLSWVYK